MAAWNQQMGQTSSATRIPADVQQLAVSYQLGTPVQAYQPAFSKVGFAVVALFSLVITGLGAINAFLALQSPNPAKPPNGMSGIGLGLILTGIGLLLLCFCAYTLVNRLRGSTDKGYECTEGFLQVDKTGAIKSALRWDQMQGLWDRVRGYQTGGAQSGHSTTYVHTYSVSAMNGLETRIDFPGLWQRIKDEYVRRTLPQAMAMFNTGQLVPFNTLLVNRQGISQDPSHLPGKSDMVSWQELTRVYMQGLDLCFEGKSSFLQLHILRVPISQTANLCLLEAMLFTVSGGRIPFIETRR